MRWLAVTTCALAAGCSTTTSTTADDNTSTPRPSEETSPHRTATGPDSPSNTPNGRRETRGAEIITADSDYGTMLYDASGQPIYLFTAEPSNRARCYDACADAWPPVLTEGTPRAHGSVKQDLLSTTRRTDGALQVTYRGHPLYYYAHEGKYEVLCHGVEEFGGTWLVIQPDGTAKST